MTTSELSFGNYVTDGDNGMPMFVQAIYGIDTVYLDFEGNEADTWETDIKDLRPIKVTEEFILKQGFDKKEDRILSVYMGETVFVYTLHTEDSHLTISQCSNSVGRTYECHIDNNHFETSGSFDFEYVHEFQNGIKLITGKDLKIKI